MKKLYVILLFSLLSAALIAEDRQKVHLFILSGQSNMVHLNPNDTFIPAITSEFGQDHVVVVKDALGTQPIRRWYKKWKPGKGDLPTATGDLYDRLMKKVHTTMTGKKAASVTFIWMQGERDAREKHGDVYAASLEGLIDQLSEDLSRDDINVVIGRLSDFDLPNEKYPHWTTVRKAQVEVAEKNPHRGWVDTDDLNDGINKAGKQISNDLHYSVEGYRTLGERFAQKAIELIQGKTQENTSSQQKSDKPNIILVMADDQGWGDAGYNGHPFVKTPTLDAMAGEGFVFDRFYAAAPVCSPTRASVLTGRCPVRSKVTNHGRYMRPQEQTMAETLKAAGYITGMFGKLHLGSGQPDSPCNPGGMGFDEWTIGLNFFDNVPYLSRNGKVEHRTGKGSVITIDDAIAFLEKYKEGDRPMFAVVWFPSPHDPHQELPDGESLYDQQKNAGYYREITLLDQQLGRLRCELRRMGIANNTILWYCSDNGGLIKETSGGREKKGSIYEGGLRVPGIIEWPACRLKGRTAVPVWTCDIYPTLMAMAGVKLDAPHPLDGIDVSDIIAGKANKRPKPLGFWHNLQSGQSTYSDRILKEIMEKQQAGAPLPHNPPRMRKDVDEFPQFPEDTATGHAAWNDWPWKLHRINGKKYELYNLADDPMETTDCAADPEQQERLERMKNELDAWMCSVIRSLNGKDYQ